MNTHNKYRPDIDGLRAVAVLSVVAFHVNPHKTAWGFIGVDIFFVISGYLISHIIMDGLQSGQFSFLDFYQRRVRRIFPALILVLVASLAVGWYLLLPDEYAQLGKHVLGGSAFVANFVLMQESGYFDTAAAAKPLLHLWSLGVEEQFYLIWPLLLWLAFRRGISRGKMILVVAGFSFALGLYLVADYPDIAFYSPVTRFWELLAGAILAHWHSRGDLDKWTRGRENLISILGCIFLALAMRFINNERYFPGAWALLPVCGAALLIAGGPRAWVNKYFLSNRAVVFIGNISYPIYLWHWPLLTFLNIIEQGHTTSLQIRVVLFMTLAFSWLTYRFVERPIRSRPPSLKWSLPIGLTLAGVGALGAACLVTDGVSGRFGSERIKIQMLAHYDYFGGQSEIDFWGKNACFLIKASYSEFSKRGCDQVKSPDRPVVMIVGDSHAAYLAEPLKDILKARNFNVMEFTAAACTPFSVKDKRPRCREINQYVAEKIREVKPAAVIAFANYWSYDESPFYGEEESFDVIVPKKMSEFLDSGARKILLVGQMPTWDDRLSSILARRFLMEGAEIPTRTFEGLDKRSFAWDQRLRAKRYDPRVTYVSLKDALCDGAGCMTIVGPKLDKDLIVFDYGHLSLSGATYVTDKVIKPIVESGQLVSGSHGPKGQ